MRRNSRVLRGRHHEALQEVSGSEASVVPVLGNDALSDRAEVSDDAWVVKRVQTEGNDELDESNRVLGVFKEADDGLDVLLGSIAVGSDRVHADDDLGEVSGKDLLDFGHAEARSSDALRDLLEEVLAEHESVLEGFGALGGFHVDEVKGTLEESLCELGKVDGLNLVCGFLEVGRRDDESGGCCREGNDQEKSSCAHIF